MPRITALAMLVVGLAAISGCGDDTDQQAKTVTVQAQPAAPPAATTTATQPPAQQDAKPLEPLPQGVIGADGTYTMRVKSSDYEQENLIVDETSPSESQWRFATTCEGSTCSIRMMRELESSGFKTLTLRPAHGRPNVFEGTATSSDECLIHPKKVATRQRYSVRLHSPLDRNGRRTAQRIDAFLTETAPGCSKGTKGALSWRGALKG
jgi:hypothetical protein